MARANPRLQELFKTPKRKTYTTVVITALVVGIFIFFTIRPTFQKIASLNKEIKEKEEFSSKINRKFNNLKNLIEKKQNNTEALIYFQEDFSKEEKSGFLVANLSAIALDYDIDLMSVVFGDEVEEDEIEEINNIDAENVMGIEVSILLEGDVGDLESFIQYAEAFPKIFDVKSVSYSKNDLSTFDEELDKFKSTRANVNMNIYYWAGDEVEQEVLAHEE